MREDRDRNSNLKSLPRLGNEIYISYIFRHFVREGQTKFARNVIGMRSFHDFGLDCYECQK